MLCISIGAVLSLFLCPLLKTVAADGATQSLSAKNTSPTRPNLGHGATSVTAHVMCEAFQDLDMKKGTFKADVVVVLEWTDERASAVIPAGAASIVLNSDTAAEKFWVPQYGITNRDLKGADKISSTVKVSGVNVVLVERFLVRVRNGFDARAFPFDSQTLRVRLSSTNLMENELKFIASDKRGYSGVAEDVCHGKDQELKGWSIREFTDVTGAMRKSRVELAIEVERDAWAYASSVFLPIFVLLGMSLMVFQLPLLGPFIMPRVATSMIASLSVMSVMTFTQSLLPARESIAWIDVFQQGSLIFVVATSALNAYVECVFHVMEYKHMANKMNAELRSMMPVVAMVFFLICLLLHKTEELEWLAFLATGSVIVPIGIYVAMTMMRINEANAHTMAATVTT